MNEGRQTFRSGDKVRVKRDASPGRMGTVISTVTMEHKRGPCELVWVKLVEGRVDGFSPQSLEKLGSHAHLRAA